MSTVRRNIYASCSIVLAAITAGVHAQCVVELQQSLTVAAPSERNAATTKWLTQMDAQATQKCWPDLLAALKSRDTDGLVRRSVVRAGLRYGDLKMISDLLDESMTWAGELRVDPKSEGAAWRIDLLRLMYGSLRDPASVLWKVESSRLGELVSATGELALAETASDRIAMLNAAPDAVARHAVALAYVEGAWGRGTIGDEVLVLLERADQDRLFALIERGLQNQRWHSGAAYVLADSGDQRVLDLIDRAKALPAMADRRVQGLLDWFAKISKCQADPSGISALLQTSASKEDLSTSLWCIGRMVRSGRPHIEIAAALNATYIRWESDGSMPSDTMNALKSFAVAQRVLAATEWPKVKISHKPDSAK